MLDATTPFPPSTVAGWSYSICHSGVTHSEPAMNATAFHFSWAPGGSLGTVTFGAVVAVGFSTTFIVYACLSDAAFSAPMAPMQMGMSTDMSNMPGMQMRHLAQLSSSSDQQMARAPGTRYLGTLPQLPQASGTW